MRIAIASRIFSPEPSAASFRLQALAEETSAAGHDVTVYTVKPSKGVVTNDNTAPFHVKRSPVLRDKNGYVRGYAQYMSFDIPLFFRLLFARKPDAVIVEPPPTTGFFVRLVCGLRKIPYFYYAADIWSDASESTGAPTFIVRAVRQLERVALRRATGVFAVNEAVAERVQQIAPGTKVEVVNNGINTTIFTPTGKTVKRENEYLIYSGTASEWQGAEIFLDALERLQQTHPRLELIFLGQGTAISTLKRKAKQLDLKVNFYDSVAPEKAAEWLRGAAVALASIKPGVGYDMAYPTKLFAAWSTGTPVVYTGPGKARTVLAENSFLGEGTEPDPQEVAEAISRQLKRKKQNSEKLSQWAKQNVSLKSVATKCITFVEKTVPARRIDDEK